jgi:3-oxoacyl-[acyl-carrier-protein] synthase II
MMSGEPDELSDTLLECGIRSGKPNVTEFGESAMRKVFPLWMLKYLPNMATCHVGIAIGALGPNNTIVLGDTSGLAALSEAVSVIGRGHADAVVCGGAGTRVSESRLITRAQPMPEKCNPVSASSRPFSTESRGIVGGEGAAAMILETAESAHRRGVDPLARVEGTAIRFVSAEPDQDISKAIVASIRGVLNATGRSAQQIGVVVSQASGHPVYDRCEALAVKETLGPNKQFFTPIASLGHSGAASGSISLAIGALIAQHQIVPPSLNWELADPSLSVKLAAKPEALEAQCVLILSHTGQGHACASIVSAPTLDQG